LEAALSSKAFNPGAARKSRARRLAGPPKELSSGSNHTGRLRSIL